MSSQELEQLREHAGSIAQALASFPAVEGVCLFGSAARGDTHEASDIDVLVVGSDDELSPSVLRRMLPYDLRLARLSLAYYSLDKIRRMLAAGLPFALHLQQEALILYDRDGTLHTLLRDRGTEAEINVKRELGIRLAQLNVYDDFDMFRGNFLFALSHLYSVGKSVVMLALAAEGAPEFNQEAAFAAFADAHPEMASEAGIVAALRPFYLKVSRHASEQLPFSYYGAENEVCAVIAAIRRLAGVLE